MNVRVFFEQLKLVEERPAHESSTFLGRDLDVVGRQKEKPIGDGLYPAVQRVGETGAEVHHPPGKLAVGVLEVQDHGLPTLEAVGEGLGVVEARRLHDAYPSWRCSLVEDGPRMRRWAARRAAVVRPIAARAPATDPEPCLSTSETIPNP